MRLRLKQPHVINDVLYPTDTIFGDNYLPLPANYAVTPFMEGLDDEGRAAVYRATVQIFGRVVNGQLLDDPPIVRPTGEERPVGHIPASKGG